MDKQLAQHRTQEQGSRIAAAAHLNYEFAMYNPGQPRHLHLAIKGHRLPNGDFDHDMLELQSKFLMEFLMEYLTRASIPPCEVNNPRPQKNEIPSLGIFQRDNPSP
jgi:hypothetical protein